MLLTYEQHVPPATLKGVNLAKVDWKLEYDVIQTLLEMGQTVHVQGVTSDVTVIGRAVEKIQPHIVFNLMDEFDGHSAFDQNVVSYLELLGVPYTGCNPRGLMLARDKALAKKILGYHEIRLPEFCVIPRGKKPPRPFPLPFPLFVKSVSEEASLGISQSSIIREEIALQKRVQLIHERVGTDALVETYIEGRECYVGVWGNQRLEALPVWELFFKKAPNSLPKIATRRVKWNADYQKKYAITSGPAQLEPNLERKIQEMGLQAFRALGLSGYARMDLRLAKNGEVFFLEANPNPQIAKGEDFADSALAKGISYSQMLWRILQLGLQWQPDILKSEAA